MSNRREVVDCDRCGKTENYRDATSVRRIHRALAENCTELCKACAKDLEAFLGKNSGVP